MSGEQSRDGDGKFIRKPRSAVEAQPTRDDDAPFTDELRKVWDRLDAVASSERAEFIDGSVYYDHGVVAVFRLASMLEESSTFRHRFAGMSERARNAIIATRNVAAHSGYAAMNLPVLWRTVTVDIPAELRRIGLGPVE